MSPTALITRTERFTNVCTILERYQHKRSMLIPILQAVQQEYRYLPKDVLQFIAASLQIPESRVYGVATFYSHFALTPKGKYVIKICNGTACHVKDAVPILTAVRERLGLTEGKNTTEDLGFTVETVSCLGACGLAPVVVVNEEVHSAMTPASARSLAERLAARFAKSAQEAA